MQPKTNTGVEAQPELNSLESYDQPLSSYASASADYALENLDVAAPTSANQQPQTPSKPVSSLRRITLGKAALVSVIITLLIGMITAAAATTFLRNSPDEEFQLAIPTQDVDVPERAQLDVEISGDQASLLVKGDVLTRGKLVISNNGFLGSIESAGLTGNHTYTLPDGSGVICLDNGNCDYASDAELDALQGQVNGLTTTTTNNTADITNLQNQLGTLQGTVANLPNIPNSFVTAINNQTDDVTIQGSTNRVIVTTNNGVITLSTPQAIGPTSTPTFGGLTISGTLRLSNLDCTPNVNGGTLTTDASGNILCADDDSGASSSVTSLNGLNNALTLNGTAGQLSITDNGSDTITLALNANVSLLGQTIGTPELEDSSVTSTKIADGTITGTDIATNTISETNLTISNAETLNYVLASDGAGGFTWVAQTVDTDTDTQLSEAQVEAYIFDADNTGTLSSGTLALGSLNFTGSLNDLYVSDTLTIGASSTVADGALSANVSLLGQSIGLSELEADSVNSSKIVDASISEADLTISNTETINYVLASDGSGGFFWVPQTVDTDTDTQLSEAQVEAYIFDADNTGTLSSGTIALGSVGFTGELTDTNVSDILTLGSSSNVAWTALSSYPGACAAGDAITALGDTITCGTFLTSYTETDPIFTASPAAGITNTQIANWDTAYGWGDHATQGYLTVEADTLATVTARGATTATAVSLTGGLTVTGGANITGGINNNNGGLTNTGNIAGAGTISATGTVTFSGGQLNLGAASSATGQLTLFNVGSAFGGTLSTAALGQATAYNLPDPGQATADICLSTGNCSGSGFNVTSVNSLQGDVIIEGTANQVIVNDNGTDTITLSLPQDIATTSAPTFATLNTGQGNYELYAMNQNVQTTDNVTFNALTLTTDLTVANGGTGASTFTTNGVLYGNGAGAINATAAGTSGQLLIASATGVPTFTAMSGDVTISDTGVATIAANSVALGTDTTGNYVATITGNSQLTVTGSGSENATVSISITADSIGDAQLAFNTGQNLTTTSDVSFNSATLANGLNVTAGGANITGGINNNNGGISNTGSIGGATTINASGLVTFSGGQLNLGAASSSNGTITLFNATNAFTLNIQAPTQTVGSATLTFPDTAGANAEICLDTGNCAGAGGGITGSGTNGQVAYFNGGGTITSTSSFLFDGTDVTLGGILTVTSGNLSLGNGTTAGALTLFDGSANYGDLVLAALGQNTTYTLPDPGAATDEICLVTLSNCIGAGSGASSSEPFLTIGNTAGLTTERAINFNGTNFTVTDNGGNSTYDVNTVQNIHSLATPTFAGLTLNGALSVTAGGASITGNSTITGNFDISGTLTSGTANAFQVDTNGNIGSGTVNGQTISTAASFTGTLDIAGLVTANGGLTVQTGDTFTVNGDAFTDLTGNGLMNSTGLLTIAIQANKGLEVDASGLSLIDCANGEVLKYETTGGTWGCASDAGAAGTGDDVLVNGTNADGANFINTTASSTVAGVSISLNGATTPDEISLQISDASGTLAGIVTADTQTFGGTKTFNGQIVAGAGINLGAQTLSGTTAVIDFNNFDVSATGAVTAVGVNAGSGLLQGTGGLTIAGTTTLSSLTNGFLEVNGSGVVSVGTIDLGTDTTGNYVATITAGNGISGSATGEGSTPTIALSDLTADWLQSGAFDLVLDNSASELKILESGATPSFYAIFDAADLTADQTFLFETGGTVVTSGNVATYATTAVTAGTGLTGGGTVGALTLNIASANGGIVVNANDLALTIQANKGLEVDASGLSLIDCANGEVLKYETTGGTWGCASDAGAAGTGDDVLVNGTNADGANFINTTASSTVAGVSISLNGATTPDEISLQISDASGTLAGIVTADTQTFGGTKTFNGQIVAGAGINLGAQTLSGTTAVIDFNNFDVSATGAVTAVGVNAGSGLLQGTGGLTIAGTTTLSSLTNGFLEVNGSGVVSVGTIDLGTDTTGNYVATITAGNGISGSATGEGSTPTIALSDLTADWLQSGAFDLVLDNSASELKILESGATPSFYAIFDAADLTADQTFLFETGGTVVTSGNVATYATTAVTAGTGLTGGGTVGALTLNIASANGGIVVNANDLALTIQANKGLEVDASGLSLIDCANGEVLKYETTGGTWGCASDAGAAGTGDDVLVNGTNADGANFANTIASATAAATTWSLNAGTTPDTINLALGIASDTEAGIVTANAQSFGGVKTFEGQIVANAGINVGTQTLQGTTAIIDFTNFDVDASGNVNTAGTIGIGGTTRINTSGTFFGAAGSAATPSYNFAGETGNNTGMFLGANDQLGFSTGGTQRLLLDASGNAIFSGAGDFALSLTVGTNDALQITSAGNMVFEGVTADTFEFTVSVADPTADRTYTIPNSTNATDEFCLVILGNCGGSGGGVTTTGGTTNRIAKFTGGQAVGDSSISDTGTLVTVLGSTDLTVEGGEVTIGTTTLQGGLVLHDGNGGQTTTLRAGNSVGNLNYTLPSADGSNGQCLKTNGTGGWSFSNCNNGSGAGGAVTLQDAYNAGNTIATTDNRHVGFTLADTTNDSNFLINIATGSTGKFAVQDNATDIFRVNTTNTYAATLTLGNALGISYGGTGATTSQGAINNISQLTTNGDLLYHNGTNSTRLGRGTNGQCLTSNATTIVWGSCGAGGDGGVTSVGTFSITNTAANGATISGTEIIFQSASAAAPGMVDTGAQTFGGAKTFDSSVTVATNLTVDTNTLFVDATNNSVGIGTTTPEFKLHVVSDGGAGAGYVSNDTYGTGAVFQGRSANGTLASPTALTDGNIIAQFSGRGYGATGFSGTRAAIVMNTAENWTDLAQGSEINFFTTPIGSTTLTGQASLTSEGNFALGSTIPVAPFGGRVLNVQNTSGNSSLYLSSGATDAAMLILGDGAAKWHIENDLNDFFSLTQSGVAQRFAIDPDGNVGIGVYNAGYRLDVQSATATMRVRATDGDIAASTVYQNNLSNNFEIGINGGSHLTNPNDAYIWQYSSNDLRLGTNNTERLLIEADGDALFSGASVAIGTAALQGSLILNDGNGQTATIQVNNTLAANTVLTIPGTLSASDTFCFVNLGNCSGSASTLQASYNADTDGSDAIIALTAADDSLIIRNPASGGSDSPYPLTIDQLNTGAFGGLFISSLGTGYALRVDDNSADTTPFIINDQGQVGIGTTSVTGSAALDVNGTSLFRNIVTVGSGSAGVLRIERGNGEYSTITQNGALLQIQSLGGGGQIAFEASGSERVRINGSGNVGIGDTTPTEGRLVVDTGATTTVGQVLRAVASQTADLLQLQNSTGTNLLRVTAAGVLQGNNGTGTDVAGSAITIAGGQGTGTGVGGNIVFQYAPAGLTGATANALQTACSISGTNGSLSCPGGSNSERFGAGSNATGTDSVAIGNAASVTGNGAIAIGRSAVTTGGVSIAIGANSSANSNSIAIGNSSVTTSSAAVALGENSSADFRSTALGFNADATNNGIAIGYNAQSMTGISVAIGNASSATGDSVAIGPSATTGGSRALALGNFANAGHNSSIAIGAFATSTAANQLIFGSSSYYVNQGYFGSGVTAATPTGFTLNATGGSGTDIAGASLTFAGGRGTGTGVGGSLLFQTAASGLTGTTLNPLTTRMEIQADGDIAMDTNTLFVDAVNDRVGIGTATPNSKLDVSGVLRLTNSTDSTRYATIETTTQDVVFNRFGTIVSSESAFQFASNASAYSVIDIDTTATGRRGLSISGISGQTADLLQSRNGNTVLSGFNATGNLFYANSGFTSTIENGVLGANRTLTIPGGSVNDTFCLLTLANCAGGTTYDGTDFIVNGTAIQTGNYNIQSAAAGSVTAKIQGHASQTANILEVGDTFSGFGLVVDAAGDVFAKENLYVNNDLTVTGISNLDGPVVVAANQSLRLTGGTTASRPGSPTEGMLFYDTDTNRLLTYTGGKWQSTGGEYTIVAASNSPQAIRDAADYVADGTGDQVEINQALTNTAGGKVYLAQGTYITTARIQIPNNTTLAGAGRGAVIEFSSGSTARNMIENTDVSTGTGIVIRDMRLDGRDDINTGGTQHGIYLNNMGSANSGTERTGAQITNVYVEDFRNNGVYLVASANNTITNSHAERNSAGFATSNAMSNVISSNTSQANTYGIDIYGSNNIVSNNAVQYNSFEGINLGGANYTSVTGNTVRNNGRYGIYLSGVSLATTNNSITGNTVHTNTGQGIFLNISNTNVISSNRLHDNDAATDNNAIQIMESDSNTITSNSISDSSCTTTCYAINISNATSDTNYLADNTLGGGSINDAGTGTIYGGQVDASGNYDLQPSGSISLLKNTDITGNLTVSGTSTFTGNGSFNGNLAIGNANTDTLTINAGTSGAGITLADSSFFNCTALETSAAGVLTCGTDDAGSGDGGVLTVGTFSTTNTAANGATISGTEIIFQSASAAAPGMVDTGDQTFAGNKTFSNNATVNGVLLVGTAGSTNTYMQIDPATGITLGGATNHAFNLYSNGVAGTVNIGNNTSNSSGKTVNIGSVGGFGGSTVNIASSNTVAQNVTIGGTGTSSILNLRAGTGNINMSGNTVLTGTLTTSGLATFNGGLTLETGDTFTINGDAITDMTGTGLTVSGGTLQTTLGTSVDLTSEVTGILPIANGGTNASTAQGAINNISGLTTNGDLLYHNGTNSTRLARGTTGQCLTSDALTILWSSCGVSGSGTAGQVAYWTGAGVQAGDASFTWDSTGKELRVYDATATNYARIYYSGGEAVFAASSGTTRVGNGTGDISLNASSGTIYINSSTTIELQDSTNVTGNLAVDSNTLFVDASTNRVGIGTNTPEYALHLQSNNVDGGSGYISNDVFGSVPVFQGRRANGTIASPLAVNTADTLAQFSGRGYDGTGWSGTRAALIMAPTQNWTSSAHGTSMSFYTTQNNTTALTQRAILDHQGYFGLGTGLALTPATLLHVEQTSTITSGTSENSLNRLNINAGAASSANYTGAKNEVFINGSSNYTSTINGSHSFAFNDSTGTVTQIVGNVGSAYHNSTGTLSVAIGNRGSVYNQGAGTISTAVGLYADIRNSNASGTVSGARAIWAGSPLATGAVTNAYGLYISTQKVAGVTNGYGIYQESASDINYLNGNTGIGISPATRLHVQSSGTNTDVIRVSASDNATIFEVSEFGSGDGVVEVFDTTGASQVRLSTVSASPTFFNGANVGIGTSSASAKLEVVGSQPTSQSGAGTNATDTLRVNSGKGGNTTGTTGQTAGSGANVVVTSGAGGDATGASGANTSGAGGAITLTAGAGGVVTSSTGTAGTGGALTLQGGTGGTGGAAGGAGGTITIRGGNAGASTNGTGGNLLLQGGAGSGTGQTGSVIVRSNTSNSTSAFAVQNASSTVIFGVDTTNSRAVLGTSSSVNGSLRVFNSTNANHITITTGATTTSYNLVLPTSAGAAGQCLKNGATPGQLMFESCLGAGSKRLRLHAEYPNSVLQAGTGTNNTGTMISDVNLTSRMSYFNWTTSETAASHSYDVVVQVPVPSDFSSFVSPNSFSISAWTDNTTNGRVTMEILDSANVIVKSSDCSTNLTFSNAIATPSTTSTWENEIFSFCDDGSANEPTFTAGDYMTLRIRMHGQSSSNVRIGNIYLDYTPN